MVERITVGPFNRGVRDDRTPFNIDDDSFPVLLNAYNWRGRIKRKRGTTLIGRLQRFFNSLSTSYNSGPTTITLDGSGNGNLLTGFSLQANGNIVPGSVIITAPGPTVYTDPAIDGTLSPSGSINYATGEITILAEAGNAVSASFFYFPDLPVMGIEEFTTDSSEYPLTIDFDTKYAYNQVVSSPYPIYDVSFYKNPPAGASLPGYIQKATVTPTSWNGQDYQQFWTVNFQGALWATNGITVPFTTANIGMQFKPIVAVTVAAGGPPAIVNLQITGHGLVVGDFLFINEVLTTTGINFQTGYVTAVVNANNVTVEFPNATIATNGTGGIAQYLTNRADATLDCIRWYDGDPTNGSPTAPVLNGNRGWVNFAPPLSQGPYSISNTPERQYYLAGARMIVPYKDRLLFIGPVIQTSATGSQIYLQDTVIYSQNGTPYYTASYTNTPNAAVDNPISPTNVFHPILVPVNQTATSPAYFEDQTGFGGFIAAGLDEPINTTSTNEDVLILGLSTYQTRLVFTGNDIVPFNFYLINSELGSSSTFTAINMDQGVMSRGARGFVVASQTKVERIDMELPDEVFQIRLIDNGTERMCAQRDFINEWVYFTSSIKEIDHKFPTQTLQYNYRENSWAIYRESYTTYGTWRRLTGFTWATVGDTYPTWDDWNDPWNAGTSNLLQPKVLGGNQQGFILERADGTGEGDSLYIQNFVNNTVTSPDHCLNNGDYIIISNCLGTVGAQVNSRIFSVFNVTQNTFQLNPSISPAGTYLGGGLIKRMYVPFIQTKQFPPSWGISRKVRLGPQQYLLTTTDNAQITLLIFLSQNASSPYNTGAIVPDINSVNDALIYTTVLYTCPESTNIGLTPANSNLQMVTALNQAQIWHRVNTSLIGDTVQLAFTMSDSQMRELKPNDTSKPITGATNATFCVITCTGKYAPNTLVLITGVAGMIQLNGNSYSVVSSNSTTITLNVDSTGFGTYISGGIATPIAPNNQFAEIELHGFILEVSPSQVLA